MRKILGRRVANKSQLPVKKTSYQPVGGWRSRHSQGRPDGHVCLPLQRADRPTSEAGRRDRRHNQAEQRLRRMWLPRSMRPMRQSTGDPLAQWRLRNAAATGRQLIAHRREAAGLSNSHLPGNLGKSYQRIEVGRVSRRARELSPSGSRCRLAGGGQDDLSHDLGESHRMI